MATDLLDLFGAHGRLAEGLPGFTVRVEQLAMAQAVADAIAARNALIVEAGTGVGKTFAYLVPALLSNKRVIISTGTRSLQDQLFNRDLPMIAAALGRPARVALLKGRANYLCRHRLQLAEQQGAARGFTREVAISFRKVSAWAQQTRRGDIGELAAVAESDPVWSLVTSTRENCLGAECPLFERCALVAARREAQAADIVVVNHHLLMADLLLKENGFGDLLPGADAVIVDEAHQLPDVATQAFGSNVSARQLRELARDVTAAQLSTGLIGGEELKCIQQLEQHTQALAQALDHAGDMLDHDRWPDVVCDELIECREVLRRFASATVNTAEQSNEVRALHERALDVAERCSLFIGPHHQRNPQPAAVRWSTVNKAGFVLHHALIDVAQPLGKLIQAQGAAWIFTSATLAIGKDLSHFASRVGLPEAATQLFGSPFDYARQALLYLPDGLDLPSSPRHTEQVIAAALPVIEASGGRSFLLFTSHRALREAAAVLRRHWNNSPPHPLYVQGEAPRDQLLQRFREQGNAVLLGTQSFWEGVDVKGRSLCVVIIDKLPFAVPDEPLTKARQAAIEQRGGNPFMEEQVPQAVVTLKQGVGRLIRDRYDFGVIMLCDRRLTTRSYGRLFLNSLPPMPRTADLARVREFLLTHLNEPVRMAHEEAALGALT